MNLIAHVEIPVRNLERAMDFYTSLFGIDFGEIQVIHGNRMAFFPFEEGKDGASGALCEGEIYVPTRHGVVIYLSVSDIDKALAAAQTLGSELLFPKTALDTGIFVAEIADSEGNRIALQTV